MTMAISPYENLKGLADEEKVQCAFWAGSIPQERGRYLHIVEHEDQEAYELFPERNDNPEKRIEVRGPSNWFRSCAVIDTHKHAGPYLVEEILDVFEDLEEEFRNGIRARPNTDETSCGPSISMDM